MPIVVGVSLRTAGKIYYFDPGTAQYDRGERVLVETARGLELGSVKVPPHEVSEEQIVPPLKNVVRRAGADDLTREAVNRDREAAALDTCKRIVVKLNLPMRLIDAQFTFDGTHVLIHFIAENRVDFRELVRELAHELHTRIELRQVGVRDEAKLLGGYGICGRQLCCSSFLANFVPVAINTAKEQGLALNPQKISGMCGRLMCCLAFEHECYKEVGKGLPRMNTMVVTPRGTGKVTKLNVLARQVEVMIPDLPGPLWFTVSELGVTSPVEAPAGCPGCAGHGGGSAVNALAEIVPENGAIAPAAVETDGGEDTEAEATGDQPSPKRRPRRRRKPGAPAAQEDSAPAVAPAAPSAADGSAQPRRSRPRRRKPRNAEPGAPVPANLTPANTAPAGETPSGAGRRRRRRR